MSIPKNIFFGLLIFTGLRINAQDYEASRFGIRPDSVTLNTRSIQFAIDFVSRSGGGRLIFESGRYLTGSIHLKSGVTLELRKGAVLLGSTDPMDYDKENFTALIFSIGAHDIGITGQGSIDGQGSREVSRLMALISSGLVRDPMYGNRPNETLRPMLIYFRGCERVTVKNITAQNSASWVQTFDQCSLLRIDSIHVNSRAFWNNDGMDIVDCDSVRITHCDINAADDGICLKSHDAKKICQHIFIGYNRICSSANAIKFGTASFGGFSHILIVGNEVYDTYRSVLALEAVDGGSIRDVIADSNHAVHTGNAVFLRVADRTGRHSSTLQNVQISHLIVEIARAKPDSGFAFEGPVENQPRNISPLVIAGLPAMDVRNITFDHVTIGYPGGGSRQIASILPEQLDSIPELPKNYPEFSMFRELPAWGIFIRHASNIQFNHLVLTCKDPDYRPAIVLDDCKEIKFTGTQIKGTSAKMKIYARASGEVKLK